MKFTLPREALLKVLQLVMGAVEKRQTLPILGHVLIDVQTDRLSLTATDLEVELIGTVPLTGGTIVPGKITVPARKLIDICRSLPEAAMIEVGATGAKKKDTVQSGKSRFSLAILPANEFPYIEDTAGDLEFNINKKDLRVLIENTHFAMASQDVRYYLNGMLFEISNKKITTVATDGHRLAFSHFGTDIDVKETGQFIVPRKGIMELLRLLEGDEDVTVSLSSNHLRVVASEFTFTSKLIDGRFPDYKRVIPNDCGKHILLNRETLKQALQRVAILSNEKFRGVQMTLVPGLIKLSANNLEQEEAEEEFEIEYKGQELAIGFNVSYLLDVLNTINQEQVKISLKDTSSSILVEEVPTHEFSSVYVIMPLRM